MNVDVKNSIDRLLIACKAVQGTAGAQNDITKRIIRDILAFIKHISIAGSEDRINLFKESYLDAVYRDLEPNDDSSALPQSFVELCSADNSLLANKGIKLSALYIATILEIGKHYSLSRYDKKEIDAKVSTEHLKELNDYSDKHCRYSEAAASGEKKTEAPNEAQEVSTESSSSDISEPEETLEELMEKLNSLIGLAGVKQEVSTLINLLKIKKMRDSRGFKTASISKHLVFLGNPGTGKTTVARLISKIYKQLGALEKGQLVEVDRAGLVAGYVGQTALKTKEKIDEAMGGILFIDEAYTLSKGGSDFGQEAIDTILKAMEDNRENFVVIVAGYPGPMEEFLESNPGLKSRFNKSITFEDYSEEELLEIFGLFCSSNDMVLSESAEQALKAYLSQLCLEKPENFANGREMRNLFETALSNQANRLAELTSITDDELNEITTEDLAIL